jgi:DnaK suppressor protein
VARDGAALRRVNVHSRAALDHAAMDSLLTAGQRAQLRELLELRQHELDARLARELDQGSRAARARDVLLQDDDDAPQRAADREIDLAQTDREMGELGAVSRALARLAQPGYGQCVDCGVAIPFDRLKAEPWAERCVPCETRHEQSPKKA